MKKPQPNSELAWKLSDYQTAGVEPPGRCVANPDLTEGEMMNADEIEEFVKDSIATLRILADKQSDRFREVRDSYYADLAYLHEVGGISEDDYNELTPPDNLHF